MYLRRTSKTHKGQTYTNYLLVESRHTPQGPRQHVVCSLGSLAPAPREEWLSLAHRLEASLEGQGSLPPTDRQIATLVEKVQQGRRPAAASEPPGHPAEAGRAVDPDQLSVEEAREAGPVHAGHQVWLQLGLNEILSQAGLSARACGLSEALTLNRLIFPLSEHAMPDWMRRTALPEILGVDFSTLHDDALYRNLDRLHPRVNSFRCPSALSLKRL